MTALMWAAIGMAIGSAVLHGALGVRRPLDRTYLSFACIMAIVAIYLVFQWQVYSAATLEESIESSRHQVIAISVFVAILLVFVPSYTGVTFPRVLRVAFWAGLGLSFVANLWSPYGLWYAEPPTLVRSTFRGEPYNTLVARPMGPLQSAYSIYLLALLLATFRSAVVVFRRGERQRGATFAIAVLIIGAHTAVDIVRDNVGGSWPYVAAFGVVTWGLVMSVQLAHDFRVQSEALANAIVHVAAQAQRLSSIVASMRTLDQNMDASLAALESGVAALGPPGIEPTAAHDLQLARLHRSVARLREFSRSMPDLPAPPTPTDAPHRAGHPLRSKAASPAA